MEERERFGSSAIKEESGGWCTNKERKEAQEKKGVEEGIGEKVLNSI